MMPSLPIEELTARANRVRSARAKIKRDLKSGEMSLADALRHPDVQGMRLAVVLMCKPHGCYAGGPVRIPKHVTPLAARALRECKISPDRCVGALTRGEKARVLAFYKLNRSWS